MNIFLILALSLVIAFLRGGRLSNLLSLRIKRLWLFFVPFLIQAVVFTPLRLKLNLDGSIAGVLYIASMLIGAIALWLNRQLPGVKWILAGFVCNFLVISLNGGYMPVSMPAHEFAGLPPLSEANTNVIPITDGTILPGLGDILPTPLWWPFKNVFSIGDILAVTGGVIFIQRALVRPLPKSQVSSKQGGF